MQSEFTSSSRLSIIPLSLLLVEFGVFFVVVVYLFVLLLFNYRKIAYLMND